MNQGTPRLAVLATAVVIGAAGLAGCATGPVDRRALCTGFDKLGSELMSANGLFDNAVFASAGDLADLADRYQGGGLSADATALERISDADATNGFELERATSGTAKVCGHPLGLGTTSYAETGSGSTQANGGYGSYGGYGYSPPTESVTSTAPEPPTSSSPTTPAGDEVSARATLQQQVDTDRTQVETLADKWVPQLSSKNHGLVAHGTTYDYRAIWADFTATRQAYPSALLLWSGDYTSYTKGDFWVTVANQSFPTGAAANAWCVAEHLDADHCFAKLVSHTHGPRGSTLPR
ncbi:hypothetical protein QRX60_23790 [Amycolatopsis mongoliensis]|uniref:Uncharacterized protein n=1 Tax=Amycolatopsis mongoliensis TaxID=715475 RepID=A0A9Y2NPA7_9PSEU|nr:hypothetical protein [Amycolatopsis sp. 4-36]WIY06723.1 hypothetical protein QRX60_23790 [Amycolatopsis sp. 4-36]